MGGLPCNPPTILPTTTPTWYGLSIGRQQVKLTDSETARLATFLGLGEDDFIQRFTRVDAARNGLALVDQPGGACVFLDGGDCPVDPVKPQRCRDFPDLWSFPGFEQVCRAKPVTVTADEWRRRVKQATGRDAEALSQG